MSIYFDASAISALNHSFTTACLPELTLNNIIIELVYIYTVNLNYNLLLLRFGLLCQLLKIAHTHTHTLHLLIKRNNRLQEGFEFCSPGSVVQGHHAPS